MLATRIGPAIHRNAFALAEYGKQRGRSIRGGHFLIGFDETVTRKGNEKTQIQRRVPGRERKKGWDREA